MASPLQVVDYHLWQSVVRVAGTATSTTDHLLPGAPSRTTDSEVLIEAAADPGARYGIRVDRGLLADTSFQLALTDDGRLSGVDRSSAGRASVVVKGLAGLAGTVVAVGARLAPSVSPAAAGATDLPPDPEHLYSAECAPAAQNRDALRRSVGALRGALTGAASAMAAAAEVAEVAARAEAYRRLGRVLGDQERRLASADTHFDAWRRSKRNETVAELSFLVPVDDLPDQARVSSRLDRIDREVLGPVMWEAYTELGAFVAVGPSPDPEDVDAGRGQGLIPSTEDFAYPGFFYRRPRLVEVFAYHGAASGIPQLRAREQHWVVDRRSAVRFLRFDTASWGDRSLRVVIGGLGAPQTITAATSSGLAGAAGALAGAPAAVVAGAREAAAAMQAVDAERDRRVDRELARLARERRLAERRAAADGAGLDVAAERRMADLERRARMLELQRAAAGLEAPAGPADPGPAHVPIEAGQG